MHRRDFLALSGAALIAPRAWASADIKSREEFGDYISSQLAATHVPGASVAMTKGGRTEFARGYGYAEVEKARHVTPDTIFQIASVSKTVTATALMLLWEDGAFKLDDPIASHLDFVVTNPNFPAVPITFRQLFTHTSGIADSAYDDLDFSTGNLPSLRDFLMGYLVPGGKWYNGKKNYSAAKPGTAWSYSNVAVALLGYLGERLSGEPLDVFTRAGIFKPLSMNNTSWRYEGVSDDRLAQPYDFVDAHFRRLPRPRYPDWPAGLLCTSANDFAKFLASYTNATLLKPETIKMMFTPDPVVVNPDSPKLRQGLVWALAPLGDGIAAFHTGGDPGTVTLAAIDTTHGNAALCFANSTSTKDRMSFERAVIRRLLAKAGKAG